LRITSRVSSPCIPVQILFPRTTSITHKLRKYNSINNPPIHLSLSRLQNLHVHSYAIHNLISPHTHCFYNKPPSTRHTSTDHRLVLTPPRSRSPPAHTTRTTNSSHSVITQRTLKKTSDPIYVEDIRSTRICPGLHEIEPPRWDRRLHHGHTAFCTWLTIEDKDTDILEIYHTILPIPTHFCVS
jgi:hypothetical protein